MTSAGPMHLQMTLRSNVAAVLLLMSTVYVLLSSGVSPVTVICPVVVLRLPRTLNQHRQR